MEKKQPIDRQTEIERETFFIPPPEKDIDLTAEQDAAPEEALYEGDEGDGSGYSDNETAWE